jgi:hypothetical protein
MENLCDFGSSIFLSRRFGLLSCIVNIQIDASMDFSANCFHAGSFLGQEEYTRKKTCVVPYLCKQCKKPPVPDVGQVIEAKHICAGIPLRIAVQL